MIVYMPLVEGQRVEFPHTRPHAVPDHLEYLDGPAGGEVTLPVDLDWTPSSTYNLDDVQDIRTMYATVIREAADPRDFGFLNHDVLRRVWVSLNIPSWLREVWEREHEELA